MSFDVPSFLKSADPEPDPLASESQADRYDHRDLEAETAESLRRELAWLRVRNHLAHSEWHIGREQAVAEALSRLRDHQRAAHRTQPQ